MHNVLKKGQKMPWNPIHPVCEGFKKCIACKENFSLENFLKQTKCKEGVRPDCKECYRKKNKKYYQKNKEKILERTKLYNKTEHRRKYCRDLAKVNLRKKRDAESNRPRPNICECCSESPGVKGIVWDHNHNNGKFRGWLCNRCNRVLGMCKDSCELFNKMSKYLEKYG